MYNPDMHNMTAYAHLARTALARSQLPAHRCEAARGTAVLKGFSAFMPPETARW